MRFELGPAQRRDELVTEINAEFKNDPDGQSEPVRVGSPITPRFVTGPTAVLSYNTYPAVEVSVDTAEGVTSGAAIAAIERLAA